MAEEPLVSVIVPSYNHARYITTALDSIVRQTYGNIEIIIIDDGSADESRDIIKEFVARHEEKRPFVLRFRENRGAPATINEGLGLATGEYLAILNSDDVYHVQRIRRLMHCVRAGGGQFLFTEATLIDESGNPGLSAWYSDALYMTQRFPTTSFQLLKTNFSLTTSNFFFSRELFNRVGGFADFATCHDWDYALRALVHIELLFVRANLLFYRLHEADTVRRLAAPNRIETTDIIGGYLAQVGASQPENHLAPCYRNWGAYWTRFVREQLPEFLESPRFSEIIF